MLFTFPSRYLFAIGLSVVFSLAGWSPPIRAEFLVFRVTQVPPWHIWSGFAYGALTLYGRAFQRIPLPLHCAASAVLQPRAVRRHTRGLGSCAFARHYWRNHSYFLFLRVLGCFGSPRSLNPPVRTVDGSRRPGFPIRTSAGQRAFAPHRGFSQLVTSFVASESHRHPPCALLCFPFSFTSPQSIKGAAEPLGQKAFALQFYLLFARFSFDFASSQFLVVNLSFAFPINSIRIDWGVPNMSMTSFSVENNGFEPLTPCLQSRCSSQLS